MAQFTFHMLLFFATVCSSFDMCRSNIKYFFLQPCLVTVSNDNCRIPKHVCKTYYVLTNFLQLYLFWFEIKVNLHYITRQCYVWGCILWVSPQIRMPKTFLTFREIRVNRRSKHYPFEYGGDKARHMDMGKN